MSQGMPSLPILLVDDETQLLKVSKLSLVSNGFKDVITVSDSREVLPLLAAQQIGLIVLDLFMPHVSGLDLLPELVRNYPQIPVIVMTAMDETETAVKCMKTGAFDYLVKPVETERLLTTIQKAQEHRCLYHELDSLRERLFSDNLENEGAFSAIVTRSKKMRAVFQYMEVVANSRHPVLIAGETGVGKELVAKAIHTLSSVGGSFVAVNVAGLDDAMFSDTLFGHKKGAFTGADLARDGLIAKAAGGTLFLDEIGDLVESSQIKLLRLLQEREYYPVGSDTPRRSDARVLLATNHDLTKLIEEGKFRRDLYYRLFAHRLIIPPLRERPEDIPLLLEHFLAQAARELGKKKPTPPPELATLLAIYHFPGNIRELEAMVHDAVARHTSGIISMESFNNVIGEGRGQMKAQPPVAADDRLLESLFGHFPTLREMEDYLMAEGMKKASGNQGIAASLLGITRQTLNKRLKGADE